MHARVTLKHMYLGILIFSIMKKAKCQCSGSPLTVYASESPSKFESPGYPTTYASNMKCQWLIDSGVAGQTILLYSDNIDLDCAFGDSINMFDGSTEIHNILHINLCGTTLVSNDYTSSDRYVLVEFITDSSNAGTGFEMTYLTAADTSGTGCTSPESLSASTAPQYLTSKNFPGLYTSDSACRWLITASNSLSTIDLEVVFSDVETDTNCVYDKLVIYDGSYVCENQELVIDCSVRTSADATPTVYTTTGNSVLVTFSSDGSFNRYGFIIKYSENFVNSTTTISTTVDAGSTTAAVQAVKTNTEKKTELSIPLMAASFVAGAAFALAVLATVKFIKFVKTKKETKKGLLTVQAIAPLPARPTVFAPRQSTNILSFV